MAASEDDQFESRILNDLELLRSSTDAADHRYDGTNGSRSPGSDTDSCKVVFSKFCDEEGGQAGLGDRTEQSNQNVKRLATVTLDAKSWNIRVKIQMTSDFPTEAPLVLIRRKSRAQRRNGSKDKNHHRNDQAEVSSPVDGHLPAEIVDFASRLTEEIRKEQHDKTLQKRNRFFTCVYFHVHSLKKPEGVADDGASDNCATDVQKKTDDNYYEKKKCKNHSSLHKKQDDDEGKSSKKPPMKTATDVINRIIWDDSVPLVRVSTKDQRGVDEHPSEL